MAIDPDTGTYGYKKVGADSVTPFNNGFEALLMTNSYLYSYGGSPLTMLIEDGIVTVAGSLPLTIPSDTFRVSRTQSGGSYIDYITFLRDGYYAFTGFQSKIEPTHYTAGSTISTYQMYNGWATPYSVLYFGETNPSE